AARAAALRGGALHRALAGDAERRRLGRRVARHAPDRDGRALHRAPRRAHADVAAQLLLARAAARVAVVGERAVVGGAAARARGRAAAALAARGDLGLLR